MNLVTAGDPEASWLAYKISGDLCRYACDPSLGCGSAMPLGATLSTTDHDTIVAWIARGATRD
jgi:hypothetical protein